MMHIYNRT